MVRENYFATMEIPFLRGRGFTAQDDQRAPQVAIVNQTFARKFFPNDDVLGKRVTLNEDKREIEIIGVVADTKYMSQREEIQPLLYTPWQQEGEVIGAMHFTLRAAGEPTALAASVRQVVRELDPQPARHGNQHANSTRGGHPGSGTPLGSALDFLWRAGAPARSCRTLGGVGLFSFTAD
jgi:hypothetical protein